MRSRSVTSFSAVVRKRRSDATGCRRASTCMQSSSMSISSWLILRSSGDHLLGQRAVAIDQRADAARDDVLDLGAHQQQLLAQPAQLALVLAVGVLA